MTHPRKLNRARNVKRQMKQEKREDRLVRLETNACLCVASLLLDGHMQKPQGLDEITGLRRTLGVSAKDAVYRCEDYFGGSSLSLCDGNNALATVIHPEKYFYTVRQLGWRVARHLAFTNLGNYYSVKWPAKRLRKVFNQKSKNPTS